MPPFAVTTYATQDGTIKKCVVFGKTLVYVPKVSDICLYIYKPGLETGYRLTECANT